LLPLVRPLVEARIGGTIDESGLERVRRGLSGVKQRSRTLVELADNLVFYARVGAPPLADDKARAVLTADVKVLLDRLALALEAEAANWSEQQVESAVRRFAEAAGVKLGQVAQPLRVALTGSTVSPGIFEVLAILGPAETISRLKSAGG
jgi:glutamyl-tRNA synthetase